MGKIMINGESYPSYVVKTGVDDTGIFIDCLIVCLVCVYLHRYPITPPPKMQ